MTITNDRLPIRTWLQFHENQFAPDTRGGRDNLAPRHYGRSVFEDMQIIDHHQPIEITVQLEYITGRIESSFSWRPLEEPPPTPEIIKLVNDSIDDGIGVE